MRIGLALSGGGTRATAFHLGVLARLARSGLLERVTRLSTVSGGSLAAALVFSYSGLRWPASGHYLEEVFPKLEHLLSSIDLFTLASITRSPWEWHRLPTQRARIIVNLLERRWGVHGLLRELPSQPEWLVNTTCIETGKNWRFCQRFMGDWKAGHHYDPPFRIAEAAVASAAVPYVIGALRLSLPEDGWYEIDPATDKPRTRKPRSFPAVSLWDGGAYENLGLEPLYKLDRGMIDCDYIVVSDASGPLPAGSRAAPLGLLKGDLASPRLFDVASDQIRSLRSRIFVNALEVQKAAGALIRMGNSVRDIDIRAGRERSAEEYARFQTDREASLALKHPTNLSAFSPEIFRRIVRHGYEVANVTLAAYCPTLTPEESAWSKPGSAQRP